VAAAGPQLPRLGVGVAMGPAACADPWLNWEGSSTVNAMALPRDGLNPAFSPQGLYCPAADAWIDPWRAGAPAP